MCRHRIMYASELTPTMHILNKDFHEYTHTSLYMYMYMYMMFFTLLPVIIIGISIAPSIKKFYYEAHLLLPGFSIAAITALQHFKELIPARYPFTSSGLSVANVNVDQCLAKGHKCRGGIRTAYLVIDSPATYPLDHDTSILHYMTSYKTCYYYIHVIQPGQPCVPIPRWGQYPGIMNDNTKSQTWMCRHRIMYASELTPTMHILNKDFHKYIHTSLFTCTGTIMEIMFFIYALYD